jgi:hypothetical protein
LNSQTWWFTTSINCKGILIAEWKMWRSNCPTHHQSLSTYIHIHTIQCCAAEFNPPFSDKVKAKHKYITGETIFCWYGVNLNRLFNKLPVTCTQTAHWHFNILRIQWTLRVWTVKENQSYLYSKMNITATFNSVTISNIHASTCPLPITGLRSLTIQQAIYCHGTWTTLNLSM